MLLRDTPYAGYLSGFVDPSLMGTQLEPALSVVFPSVRVGDRMTAVMRSVVSVPVAFKYSHNQITYGSAVSSDGSTGSFIAILSKDSPGDRMIWHVRTEGGWSRDGGRVRQFPSLDQVSAYLNTSLGRWAIPYVSTVTVSLSTALVAKSVASYVAAPTPTTPGSNPETWHCVE